MRPAIVGSFIVLLFGCASTSETTGKYHFDTLTNSQSELTKQRLINPEYQKAMRNWLDIEGSACNASIGDWTGEKRDAFSISDVRVVEGSCVEGFVAGSATITFNFTRQKNTQAPSFLAEVKGQGKAVLKGEFTQGIPNGDVELYASTAEQYYSLTKAMESKSNTQKTIYLNSLYNNGMPSGRTISIVEWWNPSYTEFAPMISLFESNQYNNGLITGIRTQDLNGSILATRIYRNGVVHGYESYSSGTGTCFENDIVVKKLQDECAK